MVIGGVQTRSNLASTGEESQKGPQVGGNVLHGGTAQPSCDRFHEPFEVRRTERSQRSRIVVEVQEPKESRRAGAVAALATHGPRGPLSTAWLLATRAHATHPESP